MSLTRDALGLGRALPDRALILVVLGMTLLAGIALGGAFAARLLAVTWLGDAQGVVMVELPADHRDAAGALAQRLGTAPGILSARLLPPDDVARLLRPWLGGGPDADLATSLPAVIELRRAGNSGADTPDLNAFVHAQAPDAVVAEDRDWTRRLSSFTGSIQAAALCIVGVVAAIATIMIGVAVRGALRTRRGPVEIVHDLGASDGYVAGIVARRGIVLGLLGGIPGALLAWGALLALARIAAPITADPGYAGAVPLAPLRIAAPSWQALLLPQALMWTLAALPVAAAFLAWAAAQANVRLWLRRLP